MEHKRSLDPDDLDRPDWNSLLNNYSKHDIGEAYFKGRVEQIGLHVENWGIDQRDDDGDGLLYDDRLDFFVIDPPRIEALLELKTKRNEDWMGVMNTRHFAKYLHRAWQYGVPTWTYMGLVDDDDEDTDDTEYVGDTIVEETFIPIDPDVWHEYCDVREGVHTRYEPDEHIDFVQANVTAHPHVDRQFEAPDGNMVVVLTDDCQVDWREFQYSIGEVTTESVSDFDWRQ